MPTLTLARNTIRINITSRMVDIVLRRQLLQNHLFVNLVIIENKMF